MRLVGLLFAAVLQAQQPHPCQPCHPREVEGFVKSAMGNSISVPKEEPEGQFLHASSGARARIFWKNGQLQHQVQQSGLEATFPASYAVGFGNVGKSYLVAIDGHLFQSPAALYSAKRAWAESPGYENDAFLDFWRPIDSSCLSCHTGSLQRKDKEVTLTPISCDRCHGSPDEHLRRPVPGSILNPAKLTGKERDSVCEQCHLEGATIVLNPGKHWGDYQPGQALEQVQSTYVLQSDDRRLPGSAAVSHSEQLALSACRRADPAKLWCATCHDPHSPAGDHKPEIAQTCRSCHRPAELSSTHKPDDTNCIGCHMPKRRASDISHAAITDHRILKHPDVSPVVDPEKTVLRVVPWRPPEAKLIQRNLGLALFNLARSGRPEGNYPEAFRLLAAGAPDKDDAASAAAEGYMLLGSGHAQSAVGLFQRALSVDHGNAEYWLDLGVAQQADGKMEAAQNSFRQSFLCNPTDYRAYEALSALFKAEGKSGAATQAVRQFLEINPQSIVMRLRHGS